MHFFFNKPHTHYETPWVAPHKAAAAHSAHKPFPQAQPDVRRRSGGLAVQIKTNQLKHAIRLWMDAENSNVFGEHASACILADPSGNVEFVTFAKDAMEFDTEFAFVILGQNPPMFKPYALGTNVATPKVWMNRYRETCDPNATASWVLKNFLNLNALNSSFKRSRETYVKWGRSDWSLACKPSNHGLWWPYTI